MHHDNIDTCVYIQCDFPKLLPYTVVVIFHGLIRGVCTSMDFGYGFQTCYWYVQLRYVVCLMNLQNRRLSGLYLLLEILRAGVT